MSKSIFMTFSFLIIIINLVLAGDQYIISQQRYVKIMPLYQSWFIEKGTRFSEMSIPIVAYFPLNRNVGINLQASQATADGEDLQKLSGISDTQLSLNYYVEPLHLVLNCGFNLPSGKKELKLTEFQTSALLSFNYFHFQVPNLGQGLNISPGMTWAVPVNDNVVLGLGASYQLKGKYKPIKDMLEEYKPGDEILITGGIDVRLGLTTTFAADVIYTIFGRDKVGSQEVFVSGKKIGVNLKFHTFVNYNELFILGQFRSKGKNGYVIGGVLQDETEKTTPDQLELLGYYRLRINPTFYLSLLGEGRSYFPTASFGGLDIFGFGLAPEFSLASNLTIPLRFKYLFGDFSGDPKINGWEVGGGISVVF